MNETTPPDTAERADDWHTYTRQYRVIQTDTGTWEIREVYFDETGAVQAWTARAASLWGTSEADLRAAVQDKLDALALPILVETDLPHYTPEPAGHLVTAPDGRADAGGHDPLCDHHDDPAHCLSSSHSPHIPATNIPAFCPVPCTCDLIARVRADERKRAALRVAAVPSFDDASFPGGVVPLVEAIVAARNGES